MTLTLAVSLSEICHAQSRSSKSPVLVLLELQRITHQQQILLASLSVDVPAFSNHTLLVALGVEQSLRGLALLGQSQPQLLAFATQQTIALTRLMLHADAPEDHWRRDWITWARYLASAIQQQLSLSLLNLTVYSTR